MTVKKREDSWMDEDDLILAETILSHIRNGSTQLRAFDEVAEKLNRTAAACGFRWNKEVRKGYEEQIKEAKLNRVKQPKESRVKVASIASENIDNPMIHTHENTEDYSWNGVMNFLNKQKQTIDYLSDLVKQLEQENKQLNMQVESLQTPENVAREDYQILMQILNRARHMGALNRVQSQLEYQE